MKDSARNLLPNGVFVRDERTGGLLPVSKDSEEGMEFLVATIPVEGGCQPGQYQYLITAIDEAGNLRRWSRNYIVAGSQ
jgi:hypothetical protein